MIAMEAAAQRPRHLIVRWGGRLARPDMAPRPERRAGRPPHWFLGKVGAAVRKAGAPLEIDQGGGVTLGGVAQAQLAFNVPPPGPEGAVVFHGQ